MARPRPRQAPRAAARRNPEHLANHQRLPTPSHVSPISLAGVSDTRQPTDSQPSRRNGDPVTSPEHPSQTGPSARSEVVIGDSSFLTGLWSSADELSGASFSDQVGQRVLEVSGANKLPSSFMLEASIEYYENRASLYLPVLDPGDLSGAEQSSLLLKYGICLVGAVIRQPREPLELSDADQYYTRVKGLLFANHEQNFLTVLKVLCLMLIWNIKGPTGLTLDGTWHWLSVAANLMFQMGLHKDSTYAQKPQSGIARRIAWTIFMVDKMMACAFVRPCLVKPQDFTVSPLSLADYPNTDMKCVINMSLVKLSLILHKTHDLASLTPEALPLESQSILESLQDFIQSLPSQIRLYSPEGRKKYRWEIFEVHILYFVAIINYCHQYERVSLTSTGSFHALVASSCIARLYEEMNCRDDVNHLWAFHNWYVMVASAPLLGSSCETEEERDISRQELDILEITLSILRKKWHGAGVVQNTIMRLRRKDSGDCVPPTSRHSASAVPVHMVHDLFPFPQSLAPRLKMLGQQYTHSAFVLDEVEYQHHLDVDISWVFDEFADSNNPSIFDTNDIFNPEPSMNLELLS
ncbi:hypothetical protein LTS17_001747 [Exophiala oligosperma]